MAFDRLSTWELAAHIDDVLVKSLHLPRCSTRPKILSCAFESAAIDGAVLRRLGPDVAAAKLAADTTERLPTARVIAAALKQALAEAMARPDATDGAVDAVASEHEPQLESSRSLGTMQAAPREMLRKDMAGLDGVGRTVLATGSRGNLRPQTLVVFRHGQVQHQTREAYPKEMGPKLTVDGERQAPALGAHAPDRTTSGAFLPASSSHTTSGRAASCRSGELRTVFFLRHGEGEHNVCPHGGHDIWDAPLTETGQQQADTWAPVAAQLNVETVLLSPLKRAMETGLRAFSGSALRENGGTLSAHDFLVTQFARELPFVDKCNWPSSVEETRSWLRKQKWGKDGAGLSVALALAGRGAAEEGVSVKIGAKAGTSHTLEESFTLFRDTLDKDGGMFSYKSFHHWNNWHDVTNFPEARSIAHLVEELAARTESRIAVACHMGVILEAVEGIPAAPKNGEVVEAVLKERIQAQGGARFYLQYKRTLFPQALIDQNLIRGARQMKEQGEGPTQIRGQYITFLKTEDEEAKQKERAENLRSQKAACLLTGTTAMWFR